MMTAEEFAVILVEAEKANLIGAPFQVSWYDGPIMGFAITDEVFDALPADMRAFVSGEQGSELRKSTVVTEGRFDSDRDHQ